MRRQDVDRAPAVQSGREYPLMLDGSAIDALIVGGGRVAARKAAALLAAGARVRLVAPTLDAECEALLAAHPDRGATIRRSYRTGDIGDALLVVAATDDRSVNATVAREAHAMHRLVNVADASGEGNCVTPALHRAGPLTIAISAGGVPGAATRIRDAIATRFDSRYGDAVAALGALRARLLRDRGFDGWRDASATLVGGDFCERVENGTFQSRVAQWD